MTAEITAAPGSAPPRRSRADQARLVSDVLWHQIHSGGHADGLPGEAELAAGFFVSRNAAREALATLQAPLPGGATRTMHVYLLRDFKGY